MTPSDGMVILLADSHTGALNWLGRSYVGYLAAQELCALTTSH